jgi:endonuclease/exonuclease/phosphatase (EEP) superfamily protein YafD
LDGEHSAIADVFSTSLRFKPNKVSFLVPVLGFIMPFLLKLPTKRRGMMWKMQEVLGEIANQLLERTRQESVTGEKGKDRSMIGTLSKNAVCLNVSAADILWEVQAEAASAGSAFMTPEEVTAQVIP